MYNPVSTYRIQFNQDFRLQDAEKILTYLQQLGVKTLYASPIFAATPGSSHGYDQVDPHQINPEIGSEKELVRVKGQLKEHGMGWLQDIVPNHMAYAQQNVWLMDVLEKGSRSLFAPFFDTVLNSMLTGEGKLMVPFLGSSLQEVIGNKELILIAKDGSLYFQYYENRYPVNPDSYVSVLEAIQNRPESVDVLSTQLRQLEKFEEAQAYSERFHEILLQFQGLLKQKPISEYLEECLQYFNERPDKLQELADSQHYRLCLWQETEQQINFRRFFTINGLICLNMQDKAVFAHYHRYIHQLTENGTFNGLRIDHIDGLYDPAAYLQDLRELMGSDVYIIAEKILEPEEKLPVTWPIQGTSGYDFLTMVNQLLSHQESESSFNQFYQELTGDERSLHEQIEEKKRFILYERMAGELENLYRLLLHLQLIDSSKLKALPEGSLKAAIGEFLIHCPVYRYYGNQFPLAEEEALAIAGILKRSRKEKPEISEAVKLLQEALLKRPKEGKADYNARALQFYQRCMQFTGPLMAKGVEDTLMYTYNRFVAHNEVGDSPEVFGLSVQAFHQQMQKRQKHWPLAMNTLTTHDTKRGEDVRARLQVLSALPEEWVVHVSRWQQLNAELKTGDAPDANDEYLIYQMLVGAYPLPDSKEADFPERFQAYLEKALREAKRHSNWSVPNTAYESATKAFAVKLLNRKRDFWDSFQELQHKVSDFGILNSLVQQMLKFCCPGVPDLYQGSELWDLSMVDPDNRRPVDYKTRQSWLKEVQRLIASDNWLKTLWKDRYSGKIKLALVHRLLKLRAKKQELFSEGQYIPLVVKGEFHEHVLAFARRHEQEWLLVAMPLHLAALSKKQQKTPVKINWKNTRIVLPAEAPEHWQQLLYSAEGRANKKELTVKELFKDFPLGLIELKPEITDRSAGLLLHITSLPSAFGMGDFGPEAYRFADFLGKAKQKYWQLLPLNPTEAGAGHSPYSSYSSMAGNTLLISPERLADDGLLSHKSLQAYMLPTRAKADFDTAEQHKLQLFEQAFQNFEAGRFPEMKQAFQAFCAAEASWLDDFALYRVLKERHKGKPWYHWPTAYRLRDAKALQEISAKTGKALRKEKWLQFIFSRQWQELRRYCKTLGISFYGDLPFYVSYDSVDVWANPEIFSLNEEGKMLGVAGVPPDYFNASGQLWGMPVFRWNVLKQQGYRWWIDRIRKNLELFDLVRLDHFRAFADYWEVPAEEETAINGQWKPGPGADFFKALIDAFGELPFIAEDLGDINDAVYELRDAFGLPGMKVLQFAFGDDMARSLYIPHHYTPNYVVYTGTHDNNTSRGWYRQDLGSDERKRLKAYLGNSLSEKDVPLKLARLAYASVASLAVVPVQDILRLDERARMNTPATTKSNWDWRLLPESLGKKEAALLREWVDVYHRA